MHYSTFHRHGLGAATAGEATGVQIGTTVATAGASAAIASAGSTGAIAVALGSTAVAIPVVGAVIAGIGMAIMAILNSGCGETCIETSQWANQAEPLLQKNIEAYFAIAPPRPMSVQQAAMNNFMTIWNHLVALCTQPGLGAAGQNCINDRAQGSCKWKATATGAYPGQPVQGACWNWWNAYYTPIQQDTQVYNDSIQPTGGAPLTPSSAAAMVTGAGESNWVMIGGAIAAALLVVTLL
jgi:hypothetical protein